MKTKKNEYVQVREVVAVLTILSIALAFFAGMFGWDEICYSISGIGMFIFGIWGSVILLKK